MIYVLALAGVMTMPVAHPYSVSRYKVIVSNVNLVKYHNCSDSDVLAYVLVTDYSFRGSTILLYAHILVCS